MNIHHKSLSYNDFKSKIAQVFSHDELNNLTQVSVETTDNVSEITLPVESMFKLEFNFPSWTEKMYLQTWWGPTWFCLIKGVISVVELSHFQSLFNSAWVDES